jgi:hypothetical protein
MLSVAVEAVRELRFDDGTPIRAASAIAPLGPGWMIAQDDATHVAWQTADEVRPVRVLPPVEGHDVFSSADGTKHLKPDFEAACPVVVDGSPAVLLLGSGSSPARMRAVLVSLVDGRHDVVTRDLSALYAAVARRLELPADALNLEGACLVGDRLRWFNRGNLRAGVPVGSVEVAVTDIVAAVVGRIDAATVAVESPWQYDLGQVNGVGLAITDAVALPDGRVLASAAAEDTPNAIDDGPVVGSALVVLDERDVADVAALPMDERGQAWKVEGLAVHEFAGDRMRLIGVVDNDDHLTPSLELSMLGSWS